MQGAVRVVKATVGFRHCQFDLPRKNSVFGYSFDSLDIVFNTRAKCIAPAQWKNSPIPLFSSLLRMPTPIFQPGFLISPSQQNFANEYRRHKVATLRGCYFSPWWQRLISYQTLTELAPEMKSSIDNFQHLPRLECTSDNDPNQNIQAMFPKLCSLAP